MNAALLQILPELALTGGLCLLLLADLVLKRRRPWETGVFVLGLLAVVAWLLLPRLAASPQTAFSMLRVDRYAAIFQLAITGAAAVAVLINLHQYRFPQDRGRVETQFLFLGATLGGFVLVGTEHLLMLYLGLEMLGLCSYALADVHKRDRAGAEAGMKYVVYGALSSGIMLYGISLLFGLGGASFALEDIALGVNRALLAGHAEHVLLPVLLLLAGFLFKLAIVPFHWWAPDVYQGTTTAIAGFLAVGSKLVALGALLRVFAVLFATPLHGPAADPALAELTGAAEEFRLAFGAVLAGLAVLSMLWGNLAALGQNHLRRLLAYSSIGHAGYLLAAVSVLRADAFHAAALYGLAYGVASLAAFSAVFALAVRAGSEDLRDWTGLGWRYPLAGAVLVISFASLVGLPPTVGFTAKWRLLAALWAGGGEVLAVLVALLSVVSLAYSFRVVRELYLETRVQSFTPRVNQRMPVLAGFLVLATLATLLLLNLGPLDHALQLATAQTLRG